MPTDPLSYGIDAMLDTRLTLLTGPELVAADIVARLEAEPGSLWYDQSYGAGLVGMLLNETIDVPVLRRAETIAEAQCRADERVDSARVRCTYSQSTESVSIAVTLELAEGDFEFTLAIDQVTGSLIRA